MGKHTCKEPWSKGDENARSVKLGKNCAVLYSLHSSCNFNGIYFM